MIRLGSAAILMTAVLLAGHALAFVHDPIADADRAIREQRYEAAVAVLEPLAEQGSSTARAMLGYLLLNGFGTPVDVDRARLLIEASAEAGDAQGQHYFGLMYYNGVGVARDDSLAFRWIEQAAAQELPAAQGLLGLMHRLGRGTGRDAELALDWYLRAAEQGYERAAREIGLMYFRADGVPQDYARAHHWFSRAAAAGEPQSARYLGLLYERGLGRSADELRAWAWFDRAARLGDPDAAARRDALWSAMSPEERLAADALRERLALDPASEIGDGDAAMALVSARSAADGESSWIDSSRALAMKLGRELKARLAEAMSQGGPLAAIEVCQFEAPAIAARVSADSDARVGRTSLRVRNPENAPDEWERQILEAFEARLADGEPAAELEAVAASRRYMKAIVTEPLCLTCHGKTLAPAIAAAIADRYPADEATGFEVGMLRGAFIVEWFPSETPPASTRDP